MSTTQHVGHTLTEPRSIIQSLTTKFVASADIAAIERIEVAFEKIQSTRLQKLSASRDNLHQWMKKVEAAKWEAQRPADRTETSHTERMAQLDRDRYLLAKGVNDLEMTLQKEEAFRSFTAEKLNAVQMRIRDLDEDSAIYKKAKITIFVFRELGVSWAVEDLLNSFSVTGETEEWKSKELKCRILSRLSNDIFTLTFPPTSNAFEDAHQMWSCLGK